MSGKHFLWRYILELQHPRYVEKFQTFFGLERLSAEGKKDVAKSPKQTTTTTTTTTPRLTPHRINNYFWYYLFFLGTKLGYEIFYALLYSFTFWNVDSLVCRRSIFVWSVCMYLGQALKDILRLPRPHPDHVLVLEPEYSLEYGMPSTHAILALSMPVTLFHSMGGRYQFSIAIFVTMALLWIALICGSRLYLGMHSLLDIFGGLSLTVLILAVVLPCLDSIDHFVTTSLYSPVVVLIIVTTLSLLYPHHNARSPTRGDTCVIIGSSAGFLLGSWLNYQLGLVHHIAGHHHPVPLNLIMDCNDLIVLLLRTLFGFVVIVGIKNACKKLSMAMVRKITGRDPNQLLAKHKAIAEIPVKLFTYICFGLAITFYAPLVFRQLNIHREAMSIEAF